MKIGISTSVIQRGQTGVAQYVFALVRELRAYASEHQFVLFVLEEDLPLFDFAKDVMEIIPVAEWHRPAVRNILWHQLVLPGLVRKHRVDVLHIPSYRRMLWTLPCPTVSTIHDLAPFLVSNKYDWKRMFYGRTVVKQLARRQRQIIAISQNTARDIQRFFQLPSSRVTVIHNGLDHARFNPGDSDEARDWIAKTYGVTKPFFLYVARFEHPGKNHVRLIEAFNRFKAETKSDWSLVLGGADWNGAEQIHAAIKSSPFRQDIHAIGFVRDKDVARLYRAAHAFVYPSLYEGFGMPPIEAMASGCPVISSARGALAEVVGDAARIVDPEQVADIQLALMDVAGKPDYREKLRLAGLERARQFDWKLTAAETMKVFESNLRAQRRPAAIQPAHQEASA